MSPITSSSFWNQLNPQLIIERNTVADLKKANILFLEDKFDECLRECKELLQQDQNNIEARLLLSNAYFQLDQFNECLHECKQLLQQDENNIEARLLLTTAYLHLNQFDEALKHAEYVQQVEATAKTWFQLNCRYIEQGDLAKALFTIEKALEIEPQNFLYLQAKFGSLIT
ncbi:tetratricopeptide repeat protein [Candidatus Protochlamydia sp. W-9]|uniref:tetratricopeptide repeat protein n=1 Tax=Candidatus Protochlamydia sp. W-9 TaxID=1785087 RepID=UPI00096A59AD|nr:tetratricopeptide repeat protein [Candidatus Protochlamydia sp. W-9]